MHHAQCAVCCPAVWLEKEGVESCVCGQDKLQRLANLLQTGWHQAAVAWCALMVLIAACELGDEHRCQTT
jgi:hypothetical protein